jgi:hypothetical protein
MERLSELIAFFQNLFSFQRLSTKGTKEKEDGENPGAELPPLPRLAREEMRMEKLALARAIKEEVRLDEERRSRKYEKLAVGSPVGSSREERTQQLHQKFGEDMEGDSQASLREKDQKIKIHFINIIYDYLHEWNPQ